MVLQLLHLDAVRPGEILAVVSWIVQLLDAKERLGFAEHDEVAK